MPNDYYPEPDDQQETTTAPEEGQETEENSGQTALIPKSVLGGSELKVGDTVTLKITHLYEDEVAVEYAPAEPEGEKPEALAGDEEFDMAEGGQERMM